MSELEGKRGQETERGRKRESTAHSFCKHQWVPRDWCYGDASIELEQGLVEDDLVNSVGSTEECPASSPEFQ